MWEFKFEFENIKMPNHLKFVETEIYEIYLLDGLHNFNIWIKSPHSNGSYGWIITQKPKINLALGLGPYFHI